MPANKKQKAKQVKSRVVATITNSVQQQIAKQKPASKNPQNQIVVNSLDDLNRVHAEQTRARRVSNLKLIQNAIGLTENFLGDGNSTMPFSRTDILRCLLDGPRDIDAECGYPSWLTPQHYKAMYDREGAAKRVVHCEPEETWALDPLIYEDDDADTETAFEAAWDSLNERFNLLSYLQQGDILSGIGQFGVILVGFDDGKPLDQPVDGVEAKMIEMLMKNSKKGKQKSANPDDSSEDDSSGSSGSDDGGNGLDNDILYVRVFDETATFIKARETDVTNPRYQKPTMYSIRFFDDANWGVQAVSSISRDVHWTRIIHLADNKKMSEVYGTPRQQAVWNRLADLRKIYAGSGEAYWKGAFPGLTFEVNPDLTDQNVEMDEDSIKKQMELYSNGTQRYMAVSGVTTKTLPPMVVDPTGTVETHLKAIAISLAIPFRVLFGSEQAQLASGQDSRTWNKRVARRQARYVTPQVIRPFIDRLIAAGVLPEPEQYQIDWPDLNAPTDQDKAQVALAQTQAIMAYVTSGASALIPPADFLTRILSFTTEQANEILDGAEEEQTDPLIPPPPPPAPGGGPVDESPDEKKALNDNGDPVTNKSKKNLRICSSCGAELYPDGSCVCDLDDDDDDSSGDDGYSDDTNVLSDLNLSGQTTIGKGKRGGSIVNRRGSVYSGQNKNLKSNYSESEARDEKGEWTTGGATDQTKTGQRGTSPGRKILLSAGERTQRLQNAPETIIPNGEVRQLASDYANSAGIDYKPNKVYAAVDSYFATHIATAYEAMKHDPSDPAVAKSYQAMMVETKNQYHAAIAAGYKFEPFTGQGEPYKNSIEMRNDVAHNKHLFFFPTKNGFGGADDDDVKDNPLLQDTGEKTGNHEMVYNDMFRAVHDLFGHAKDGVGFGPRGEENAWLSHASMFSDEALPAMTSETRGQNSWVNFGPHGAENRAHPEHTIFAKQKTGLLPATFYRRGLVTNFDVDEARDSHGKWTDSNDPTVPDLKSPEYKEALEKWGNSLSDEEQSSLRFWTGTGYREIRHVYQKKQKYSDLVGPDKEQFDNFKSAFGRAPVAKMKMAYRGFPRTMDDTYALSFKVGKVFTFDAPTSLSTDPKIAEHFSERDNGFLPVVLHLKNARAVNHSDFSSGIASEEHGLIAKPGDTYKITKVEEKTKTIKFQHNTRNTKKLIVHATFQPKTPLKTNYSASEARDDDGRWTDEGGHSGDIEPSPVTPKGLQPDFQGAGSFQGTLADNTDENGVLSPIRKILHKNLVDNLTRAASPVKVPTVTLMGGGPASGKSTLIDMGMVSKTNSVMAAPDEIKSSIPEYQMMLEQGDVERAAPYVHEESSVLGKEVTYQALQQNKNVIVDGTGDSGIDRLQHRIDKMRASGAKRIVGEYVTVPTNVAVARNEDRFLKTRRAVPEAAIRYTHKNVSLILPEAMKRNMFDEVRLWDTDVAKGAPPIKVMEQKAGKVTILNAKLWNKFLKKGSE